MLSGYSNQAPAKSGVGISLPDIHMTHSRVSGFFMRKAQLHPNYGGLAGALRRAGFHVDR
ncbi:TPA: ash family protein [Salmonella enterica]|nr:ash family protein [Salmonella enterica]